MRYRRRVTARQRQLLPDHRDTINDLQPLTAPAVNPETR